MSSGLSGIVPPPGAPELGHDDICPDGHARHQRGGHKGQQLAEPHGGNGRGAQSADQKTATMPSARCKSVVTVTGSARTITDRLIWVTPLPMGRYPSRDSSSTM